jgi:hypothetical protein
VDIMWTSFFFRANQVEGCVNKQLVVPVEWARCGFQIST